MGVWSSVRRVAGRRLLENAKLGVIYVAVGSSGLVACGPSAVRVGPALPSAVGAARGPCESASWYEAAPARVRAQGAESLGTVALIYQQDIDGVGLFRPNSNGPEELEDAWPRLQEPELQRKHEARIEPVEAAERRSFYWAMGGIVGLGAGVGTAAAIGDSHRNTAAVFGVSGLVVGLVGVVGALIAQPSGPAQLQAEARRKLFIEGEDDLAAVRRGVERNNAQLRTQCTTHAGQMPP